MINGMLRNLHDEGVIAYLDDILIYLEDVESHIDLVRRVFELIRKAKLCVSINKFVIHQCKVVFVEYDISEMGTSMISEKVEAVKSGPVGKMSKTN
jgi:hypothetical protein